VKTTVYFEVSEFLANPLCTGIQRVVFEIAKSWPKTITLQACFVSSTQKLITLPNRFFELMNQYFSDKSDTKNHYVEQIRSLAATSVTEITQSQLDSSLGLLIPEVFFDPKRIEFYHQLLDNGFSNLFVVGYDMLPWLHPEWFSSGAVLGTMPYLKLLTRIPFRCFISTQSARDFRDRILRTPTAPLDQVIPLGADALGCSPLRPNLQSREFIVLGSVEPRKNHVAILDAFEKLWNTKIDCRLSFLGRVGWVDHETLERLNTLVKNESRFEWLQHPSDQTVLSRIKACRATIYPSLGEGYGLPPVESLALGVPVIVSATLPSIEMIAPLGQIRISPPNADAIEKAVVQMLDDTFAGQKYQEVAQLQPQLPRWSDLGASVLSWMQKNLPSL